MDSFILNAPGASFHWMCHVPIMVLSRNGTKNRICGGFPVVGWVGNPAATSDQTWSTIMFMAMDVAYSERSVTVSSSPSIHAPAQLITMLDWISKTCPVCTSLALTPVMLLSF